MAEIGLIDRPELMAGTVFVADEIHEYVIDKDAAEQLAAGTDDIAIKYIGGDPARTFSRAELIGALRATKEFDQVGV